MRLSFKIIPLIYGIFFSCITLSLCFAEQESPEQVTPPFRSLLNYQAEEGQFTSELKKLESFTLQVQATKDRSEELNSSRQELVSQLLKEKTRGFHDEVHFLDGYLAELFSEMDYALKAYSRSLELRASNPLPLFRSAMILKEKGLCKEALAFLNEVRWRTDKALFETYYLMAECFLILEDQEKAVDLLTKSSQLNPFHTSTKKLLLKIEDEQILAEPDPAKRFQMEGESLALLRSVLQQNPSDTKAAKRYSALVTTRSDPLLDSAGLLEAENIMKRVTELKSFKDDEAVKILFDTQIKQRKFTEAKQTIDKGLAKSPNSPLLKAAERQLDIESGISRDDAS